MKEQTPANFYGYTKEEIDARLAQWKKQSGVLSGPEPPVSVRAKLNP